VAAAVFLADPGSGTAGWVPGLRWIAPVSFVVAAEFVYWSGWHDLRLALPLVLAGLLVFLGMHRTAMAGRPLAAELRTGGWLVVFLVLLTLLSWLGSFGGSGRLPAPWDSLAVAATSFAVFFWAVRAGTAWLRESRQGRGGGLPGATAGGATPRA
jgi:hypothetical protein